jgi:hypothetical protein
MKWVESDRCGVDQLLLFLFAFKALRKAEYSDFRSLVKFATRNIPNTYIENIASKFFLRKYNKISRETEATF